MTTVIPGQGLAISAVPNLRDLGGWATRDGSIRRGVIYRSAEFSNLGGADADAFAALGVRTVYDFRTLAECDAQPNVVPAGTAYVAIDILADARDAGPAQLLNVLGDPASAEAMLGGGRAEALFTDGYRKIVSLPSALAGYRQFFTEIADGDDAVLFHCTTGKDRTGWAAAALLELLGVRREDVVAEYLLTNEQLLPSLQPVLTQFADAGGDPELLMPVLGVRREYLEAAYDEVTLRFKDVDGYFTDGLGLDAATIDRLRTRLTA